MKAALALLALAAAGCTTLAPEARNIRVTENDAEVAGCKVLGAVESHPPYGTPSDGMNQLKNQAAGLGADTIYLTARGLMKGKSAMAYRCEQPR